MLNTGLKMKTDLQDILEWNLVDNTRNGTYTAQNTFK